MVFHKIKLHVQACAAAFQFLTRIPIPMSVPFERHVLTRSVIYFPLAGLVIGLVVGMSAWLLGFVLPPWPASAIVLAIWTGLSGGLHMDGWMDTADGVLSHRSRERMLEIMKDSRVGAMGVLSAVFLLLIKVSLLVELIEGQNLGNQISLLTVIIMAACWSRAWMTVAITGWSPARKNEGVGVLFNGIKRRWSAISLSLAAIISFTTLIINDINYINSLFIITAAFLITMICGYGLASWLNRKLGGLTGDTYGAMNEAIELAILLGTVIWTYTS
ncbi:adenosylcobinamide-GDP ribazoletransferase [Paenibacillus sp. GSMTC-2017]|uniref:adenosylcobinamide-GDP ribazoletransferase n=1 Tax=Paenibacillus sp. GSMTC-2017 TaxID=2794350 RepID=UPI0018D91185|nr:adenosylcobinamide-GDP ribazoletransferase [Paenibacillus sp. GSMTC-2017]